MRLVAPALLAVCGADVWSVPSARHRAPESRDAFRRAKNATRTRMVTDHRGMIRSRGLAMALHVCGGHFETCDERPFFGRLRGTRCGRTTSEGASRRAPRRETTSPQVPAGRPECSCRRQAGATRSLRHHAARWRFSGETSRLAWPTARASANHAMRRATRPVGGLLRRPTTAAQAMQCECIWDLELRCLSERLIPDGCPHSLRRLGPH